MTFVYQECAALGRPFTLGTLYDCRSDTLIQGMTLWDMDTIKEYTLAEPESIHQVGSIWEDLENKQLEDMYYGELEILRTKIDNGMFEKETQEQSHDVRDHFQTSPEIPALENMDVNSTLHINRCSDSHTQSSSNEAFWKEYMSTMTANSGIHLTYEDSVDSRTRLIGIKGDQKLSVISGLCGNLDGSAKFVYDGVTTANHARVILSYGCTTRSQKLSTAIFNPQNSTYLQAFTSNLATHVVVGVKYGADAHFVFDSITTSATEKYKLSDLLKKKIYEVVASTVGKWPLKWNESDKYLADIFSCKFYGDFRLVTIPVTVKSALLTHAMLPSLLGPNKNFAVPKIAYLLPLSYFNNEATTFVREISTILADRLIQVQEELLKQECEANEILSFSRSLDSNKKILAFDRKLIKYTGNLKLYQQLLNKKFASMLPKIRSGEEDDSVLRTIFDEHDASPFSGKNCDAWLRGFRTDVQLVTDLILKLTTFPFKQYDDISNVCEDAGYVVCVVITVGVSDDYLELQQVTLGKCK